MAATAPMPVGGYPVRSLFGDALQTLQGKVVFVDVVNGTSGGSRGDFHRPYATPEQGRDAAFAGDLVIVGPGSFTCTTSLLKDGVDWLFPAPTRITMNVTGTVGIWDDGGTAITSRVMGSGIFTRSGSSSVVPVVQSSHASSVISVEASELELIGGATASKAVACSAGTLSVKVGYIHSSGGGAWLIHWVNGALTVTADRLVSDSICFVPAVASSPTGSARIFAGSAAAAFGVYGISSNASAISRVTFLDITSSDRTFHQEGTDTIIVEDSTSLGRVDISNGTLRLRRNRIDTSSDASNDSITVVGGTLIVEPGHVIIPNAAKNSIGAASAKNATVYPGSVAKYAVHANITQLVSSLTVSTSVV